MARMTTKQLFIDVFRDELEEQGFVCGKKFFYRMKGNILQGIGVDSTGPQYDVRYIAVPYWCYRRKNWFLSSFSDADWVKRVYAIDSGVFFKNDMQESEKGMRRILETYRQKTVPLFEAMMDEESYIDATLKYNNWFDVDQYVVLYIAYKQNSWDYVKQFIENSRTMDLEMTLKLLERNWAKYQEFQANPPEGYDPKAHEMTYEDMYHSLVGGFDETLKGNFRVLLQKMEENDLAWIESYRKQEAEAMKEDLRALQLTIAE